jgi:hypothetical protein
VHEPLRLAPADGLVSVVGVECSGRVRIVGSACGPTPARPTCDAPTWSPAVSADWIAWTDAGLFVDGGPDGEALVVGGPVGGGLDEVLAGGDGLADDELLAGGLGDWAGLLLADPAGAVELVRQLGDTCGDELRPGWLDPGTPPPCELCGVGVCLPFGPGLL